MGDEGGSVGLDEVVGICKVLPDLHVARSEVTERPGGGGSGGEFLIEGNAGDIAGGESGSRARSRSVHDIGGVGAVDTIPHPNIHGPSTDSSSLIGVQVQLRYGVVRIVVVGDR